MEILSLDLVVFYEEGGNLLQRAVEKRDAVVVKQHKLAKAPSLPAKRFSPAGSHDLEAASPRATANLNLSESTN